MLDGYQHLADRGARTVRVHAAVRIFERSRFFSSELPVSTLPLHAEQIDSWLGSR